MILSRPSIISVVVMNSAARGDYNGVFHNSIIKDVKEIRIEGHSLFLFNISGDLLGVFPQQFTFLKPPSQQ